ncbi:unnamed protein product [Ilex paraguariensis]|uniref:Uncharacterized protein n=1 Tax=Ilex paraguariensis TaxID=185542 RepID=A0ABC8TDI2_9AQUA
MPDIVLGADVIYNPSCLPHLVRVLAVLLNRGKSYSRDWIDSRGLSLGQKPERKKMCYKNELNTDDSGDNDRLELDVCKGEELCNSAQNAEYLCHAVKERPVAFIASVIRNIDTFNHFLTLADQANLIVTELTEKITPFNLLPYLKSYQRSSIRMFTISYLCD